MNKIQSKIYPIIKYAQHSAPNVNRTYTLKIVNASVKTKNALGHAMAVNPMNSSQITTNNCQVIFHFADYISTLAMLASPATPQGH